MYTEFVTWLIELDAGPCERLNSAFLYSVVVGMIRSCVPDFTNDVGTNFKNNHFKVKFRCIEV